MRWFNPIPHMLFRTFNRSLAFLPIDFLSVIGLERHVVRRTILLLAVVAIGHVGSSFATDEYPSGYMLRLAPMVTSPDSLQMRGLLEANKRGCLVLPPPQKNL